MLPRLKSQHISLNQLTTKSVLKKPLFNLNKESSNIRLRQIKKNKSIFQLIETRYTFLLLLLSKTCHLYTHNSQ